MKENGFPSPLPDILSISLVKMIVQMRKPDMTKNTSTPQNDPKTLSGKAWKRTTDMTAMARSPSMSGRYLRLLCELELRDELLWPVRGGYF